jgi:hypothetical protein
MEAANEKYGDRVRFVGVGVPQNQTPAVVLERLRRVSEFRFEARWVDADGSFVTGHGAGRATVRGEPDHALVVDERGQWEPRPGQVLRFRGGYRWSVAEEGLAVAHLRRGEDHPVVLVRLVVGPDGGWRSVRPFVCGADEYSAHLRLEGADMVFRWMVRGPRKAYTLAITYQPVADGGLGCGSGSAGP